MSHSKSIQEKQRLSIARGAPLLGVSPFTLRRWIRERRVPHYRCGRRIVLDRDDLETFLRAGRVEALGRGEAERHAKPKSRTMSRKRLGSACRPTRDM
jgi:excisionase family DNA binding protein